MLLDIVQSMMAHVVFPYLILGDALLIVAYLLNHLPSKLVKTTHYKLWTGSKPPLTIYGHIYILLHTLAFILKRN